MRASRVCRLTAALIVLISACLAGGAQAGTPTLVVDADSGRVLHAERATDPWFPASITKLMTAYVALAEIRAGRASLDSVLTMSPRAAAMPPSKMGFKPGTELTLDNALKIIMVKSANDVSVAIAEGLGGTVEGFADMMNAHASRLGMRESRFVNPHGLPDERQQTSARDMAILARALLREFPDHHDLFGIGAIQFGRRVMANHNGLIGRYPGADGMKTGFICASGFNVVATASRGGRRLITVVLGSTSASERTLTAAALFDRGFSTLGLTGSSLADLPPSNILAPPNMRPVICERRGPLPSEEEGHAPIAANASGNADNPLFNLALPNVLAFADSNAPLPKPVLGPRAPLQPILVWTGRTPPGALAKGAPRDEPAASRSLAAEDRPAKQPAARVTAAPGDGQGETALADDGKKAKAAARTKVRPKQAGTAKQKPGKASHGKAAAKPKPKPAAAKADAKTAGKSAPSAAKVEASAKAKAD